MPKNIALMDKYRSFYSEGPNFEIYVLDFLKKGCKVFQLDPDTIDFKNKRTLVYPLLEAENKITNITELNVGDIVLIFNPLIGESVVSVMIKMEVNKYPFSDINGSNTYRSLGRINGLIKFESDQE